MFYADIRVFTQQTTPIRIGLSEFDVVIPDYDDAQYAEYIRARNVALGNAYSNSPDARLSGLPRQDAMYLISSTCVHGSMDYEDFG